MTQKFKASNNVTYSCKYHIVWCPKYRRKVLMGKIAERLKVIITEVAAETGSEVLEQSWNWKSCPTMFTSLPRLTRRSGP